MLYIVGTPIGNLDDISIRQAKIITDSDIILAEDTRSFNTLLQGIKKRFNFENNPSQIVISYFKDREFEKLPFIIEQDILNKKISLVSESGMPLISDPGNLLISTLIKRNISFTVIPGTTALTTALIYSGFNSNNFMFLGFMPKKESQIKLILKKLHKIKQFFPESTFIFYESPNRINKTLSIISQTIWNPDIVIARELTKKFEEIIRGKANKLMKNNYKGEVVLLLN